MKPRKLYERNLILHCCFKGSHYAPEAGEDTSLTSDDRVYIVGGDKGCDTVDVRGEQASEEETWVRTDIDAGSPVSRREDRPHEPSVDLPDDEGEALEAALEAVQDRVNDKVKAAQASRPATRPGNILELGGEIIIGL